MVLLVIVDIVGRVTFSKCASTDPVDEAVNVIPDIVLLVILIKLPAVALIPKNELATDEAVVKEIEPVVEAEPIVLANAPAPPMFTLPPPYTKMPCKVEAVDVEEGEREKFENVLPVMEVAVPTPTDISIAVNEVPIAAPVLESV